MNKFKKVILKGMIAVCSLGIMAPAMMNNSPIFAAQTTIKCNITQDCNYNIDSPLYFWYNHFNDSQKSLYKEILEKVQKADKTKINIDGKYSGDEIRKIVDGIQNDHPELFWFEGTYTEEKKDDKVLNEELQYNDYADNLEANKKAFEDKTQAILEQTKDDDIIKQELKIHDYIAKNFTYKKGTHDQVAFSGIVEGNTVCAGFSRSFQYLMQKLGIPCYMCIGVLTDPSTNTSGAHGWNIIKLGNAYYNVDVTSDQQLDSGYIMYENFNATDKDIEKMHERDEESKQYPACNSDEYSYKNITGQTNIESVAKQTNATLVNSLEDYYKVCYEKLTGSGNQVDFYIVLKDKGLFNQINQSIVDKKDVDGYANKAGQTLGLKDPTLSVNTSYSEFNDGYKMHVSIELKDGAK